MTSIPPSHQLLTQCLVYGMYSIYSCQVSECLLFWSYYCLFLSFIILPTGLTMSIQFPLPCLQLSLKVLMLPYFREYFYIMHYLWIQIPALVLTHPAKRQCVKVSFFQSICSALSSSMWSLRHFSFSQLFTVPTICQMRAAQWCPWTDSSLASSLNLTRKTKRLEKMAGSHGGKRSDVSARLIYPVPQLGECLGPSSESWWQLRLRLPLIIGNLSGLL